jgi:hypothetical protein
MATIEQITIAERKFVDEYFPTGQPHQIIGSVGGTTGSLIDWFSRFPGREIQKHLSGNIENLAKDDWCMLINLKKEPTNLSLPKQYEGVEVVYYMNKPTLRQRIQTYLAIKLHI